MNSQTDMPNVEALVDALIGELADMNAKRRTGAR
jgi:hypothetical protein